MKKPLIDLSRSPQLMAIASAYRRDMERLSKMTPKQLMALLMRGPRKQ